MQKLHFFLGIFLIGLIPQSILAQPLTGSPSTYIVESADITDVTDFGIVVESLIYNNTAEDIEVKWTKTKSDLPENWLSLICDPITCWGPDTNTGPEVITIPANGSIFIDVHFLPNEIQGDGLVEVCIWAIADSASVNLKMSYALETVEGETETGEDSTSVNIDTKIIEQVNLYPNPAEDNLVLDLGLVMDVHYLEVYDLSGHKLKDYFIPYNNGKPNIEVSSLPMGTYLLRLYDKNQNSIGTKSFVKKK